MTGVPACCTQLQPVPVKPLYETNVGKVSTTTTLAAVMAAPVVCVDCDVVVERRAGIGLGRGSLGDSLCVCRIIEPNREHAKRQHRNRGAATGRQQTGASLSEFCHASLELRTARHHIVNGP